ncbi:MAG: TPM domain-containing protein [Armatimonadetes bacterium]|nr:TPM domain-containing protein [Armatimonadota bacterium]
METIFTPEEAEAIVAAIQNAESRTSGEIRVRIENHGDELLDRARRAFDELGMRNTRQRNGVLFVLAVGEQKFVILADDGIFYQVPEGFWDEVQRVMHEHFQHGRLTQGLVDAIGLAGEQLAAYFPSQEGDLNELPDAISFATD